MMLLTMNTYLTLLWWASALFSAEAMSASTPQTSGTNSTAEPDDATTTLDTSRVRYYDSQTQTAALGPTHQPVATAGTAASNAAEGDEAYGSSAASGSSVSWPRAFTSATKAAPSHDNVTSDAAPSHDNVTSDAASSHDNVTSDAASSHDNVTSDAAPSHDNVTSNAAPSHDNVTSDAAPSHDNVTSDAASSHDNVTSDAAPSHDNVTSDAAPSHDNVTSDAASSHDNATSDAAEPTTSTRMATTAATPLLPPSSAASLATAAASTLEATSATEPGATHEFSSSGSSAYFTHAPRSMQDFSAASASTGSTVTEAAADPTSSPVVRPETARAEPSSPPQSVSGAQTPISNSKPPDTTGSSSGSISPTTSVSTSPAGVSIRTVTKLLSVRTTKSAANATAEVQSCSSRGVVTKCLIIIASLAGLATIFMVSTIVLCAKLSARKDKAKRPKQETEMMCISALLPDRSYTYTRQRNPVSNGILVLPLGAESDDDMGDNLTLSSFLPENERIV